MADWTKQMVIVHGDNGMWAVLHFIASLFRDHVFSCLSFFPHMFGFGQPQTGKSACARSINSIFFGEQTPFNLSSGTQVSFYRKLAQFRNAVVWMDEYRNDIDPKRIQALKAGYDGAGHEKGVMSNDNRTTITKPNSAIWITGQHIPTVDESALFTRSIFRTFERKAQDVSVEERKEFEKLQKWQQEGLSHLIVDIIRFRDKFLEEFEKTHSDTVAQLKNDLFGQDYEGRIMENYGILISCNKLFKKVLSLPFDEQETYRKAMEEIIKQSEQVTESDALRGYWKMIEFLSYQYGIKEHEDYLIQDTNNIVIREGRDNVRSVDFGKTKRVLFLRFTKIHPLYMEAHRKQYGENGLNEQSIKSYMKTSRSFLGITKNIMFNGTRTSAYAFDYDMIGVDLKLEIKPEPKKPDSKDDLPF
jgi:hypothetical protein